MNKDEIRHEFTARLIEALNDKKVEPQRRAATLARWVNKNHKNPEFARKWLTGRSIPQRDNLLAVAKQLGVRSEWLEYGVGPKTLKSQRDEVRALLEEGSTKSELQELIHDISSLNQEQVATIKALVKTWLPHSPK